MFRELLSVVNILFVAGLNNIERTLFLHEQQKILSYRKQKVIS